MPSFYGPRPNSWGGSQLLNENPGATGVGNPFSTPFPDWESCFNRAQLKAWSAITDDKEFDELFRADPNGEGKDFGFCASMLRGYTKSGTAVFKITKGTYAGGKVVTKTRKGLIDSAGNMSTEEIPLRVYVYDKNGSSVDWNTFIETYRIEKAKDSLMSLPLGLIVTVVLSILAIFYVAFKK